MKRTSYTKTLVSLALALIMALAMVTPAFARSTADPAVRLEMIKDCVLSRTTATLSKLPTNLEPTPTAEDLNFDPLSYWHEIIPIVCGFDCGNDSGVEKTMRPATEIYQELKQVVNGLTEDKTTVVDKYAAIYLWVESNIHYNSDNRTNNIYLAYERGYGACSEQSNMLYIMATLAGIKAAVLLSEDHQSTAVMDENGKWFGDAHEMSGHTEPAKYAYYTDGMDQYRCDLETGEIKKLRTFRGRAPHTAFDDVPADAWYADAVDWAVAKGITTGTGKATFSPLEPCTEAQVLTFLYRAEGSPDYSDVELPITLQNNWATDAYKWGAAEHIYLTCFLNPDGSTKYPDENSGCSRARAVQYIWNAFGSDCTGNVLPFHDTEGNPDVIYFAVYWAVRRGIVNGTSETTFSPDLICNRATVVTMLYRAYGME